MNNEIKAVQPAHNYDASKAKLLADLKIVGADAEKLLKEAADSSVESFAVLRTQFEDRMNQTKEKLGRARMVIAENAQCATASTQEYVKQNPWKSVGVIAAAGVICGLLMGRRKSAPDPGGAN